MHFQMLTTRAARTPRGDFLFESGKVYDTAATGGGVAHAFRQSRDARRVHVDHTTEISEPARVEDMHVGGGIYELPGIARVKGKAAARKALGLPLEDPPKQEAAPPAPLAPAAIVERDSAQSDAEGDSPDDDAE